MTSLHFRPVKKTEYVRVSPPEAGWQHLNFAVRQLREGGGWVARTEENEMILVILSGLCHIDSSVGSWRDIGQRMSVFEGLPYAIYFPPRTEFTISVTSQHLDIAYGWCVADTSLPAKLIPPQSMACEIQGSRDATCQVHQVVPPSFPANHLMVMESYIPGGNWGNYPPHKHDTNTMDDAGNVLENHLEEVCFYKMEQASAFAYQHIYTEDGQTDTLYKVQQNHLVVVPQGYHPLVTAHGYMTYVLHFFYGEHRNLTHHYDPAHCWLKDKWTKQDPRLPLW